MKLGGLFYPVEDDKGNKIPFDSLYIWAIYKEIYLDGVYIDVLNVRENLTIIDVGANIGITVQHFQPYCKKLYAIEPSPEHFTALKKNKEFNNWDNVELFEMALADKDGEMELAMNEGNRTMNTLMVGERNENGKYQVKCTPFEMTTKNPYSNRVKVKTQAFDTFFKENNIGIVDFCKFDVEGAEDMILRSEGFKKITDKIKAIEVEFHFPNWPQLADYLVSLGYQARRYRTDAIILL